MSILFYLDLITLTCFDQSWSSSEGSSFNQYIIYTRAADRERHTTMQGDRGTKQRRKEEAWPPGQRLQEEQNSLISKTTQQLKF
jgi:hypothetical protein